MITVIAAVGENGEYGGPYNGLPWKCPLELEHFWGRFNEHLSAGSTVLIGAATWFSFPEAVRSRFLEMMTRASAWDLHIFDPKGKYIDQTFVLRGFTEHYGIRVQSLRNISKSYVTNLSAVMNSNQNVICLGGAHLIRTLLEQRLVSKAFVSRMRIDEEHPKFNGPSVRAINEECERQWPEGSLVSKENRDRVRILYEKMDEDRLAERDRHIRASRWLKELTIDKMPNTVPDATIMHHFGSSVTSEQTDSPVFYTVEVWYF